MFLELTCKVSFMGLLGGSNLVLNPKFMLDLILSKCFRLIDNVYLVSSMMFMGSNRSPFFLGLLDLAGLTGTRKSRSDKIMFISYIQCNKTKELIILRKMGCKGPLRSPAVVKSFDLVAFPFLCLFLLC